MKYQILMAAWPDELEKFVNDALDCGWEVCGSPFIDRRGSYYQAMTKK